MPGGARDTEQTVQVTAGRVTLEGTLAIPSDARGVVLFAHGSGSSRHSPRNRFVAEALREGGLATLLVDLLTAEEEAVDERTRHLRFDIGLLAERLVGAIDWLGEQADTRDLRVGLFGASTGGGAALVAAANRPERVGAVVSRGGRPDLAGDALPLVRAPTLLIVGEWDEPVIDLNERARDHMRAEVRLEIVPRATHLFEEPGALEEVARLARAWFVRHLAPANERAAGARDTSTAARGRSRVSGEDELTR
jgi:putative phosphoribosyl transferase